ncbi:MAG TPA: translation initiation factor [Kofleriaceae bacterium]|nr:translation initiation factor [Kofleriaceae bacterium]
MPGKDSKTSPFAALEKLRDQLPSRPEVSPSIEVAPPRGPARAVVRLERKGRRGKDVTVVDKLALREAELETWCRDLKQALGCGGAVDGDVIVLQGDLRPRLPAILSAKGVAKITVS